MSKDVHEDLLRLACFEEDEMSTYLPEWRKTAEKLRLTEDGIKFAIEKWIPAHLDISLKGIRMSVGGVLRGLIDLTKAEEYKERGYKLVYGIFPSGFQYFYALKLAAPDKVFVSNPDAFLAFALGILFYNNVNQYFARGPPLPRQQVPVCRPQMGDSTLTSYQLDMGPLLRQRAQG
jgi:hypothetical protein